METLHEQAFQLLPDLTVTRCCFMRNHKTPGILREFRVWRLMMDRLDNRISRRKLLSVVGSGTVGFASCLDGNNQSEERTSSENGFETVSQTATDNNRTSESTPGEDWNVEPLDHGKLVIAEYLPWYWGPNGFADHTEVGWLEQTPSVPVLGEYSVLNQNVINQHIKWALEHGVNVFSVNVGAPRTRRDRVTKNHLYEAELADRISFINEIAIPPRFAEDNEINLDKPDVRQYLRDRFSYQSNTYFDRSNYLFTSNDKPVLYFYGVGNLSGDVSGALEAAKDAISHDPYLIGDLFMGNSPGMEFNSGDISAMLDGFDAVTEFGIYPAIVSSQGADAFSVTNAVEKFRQWSVTAKKDHETAFLPSVTPGFDETEKTYLEEFTREAPLPILERDATRFSEFCDEALDFIDSDLQAVFINGFNGWIENTQIEPGESYGTDYLEVVAEEFVNGTSDELPISPSEYISVELTFNKTVQTDIRHLTLRLFQIRLRDADSTIRTYDIGDGDGERELIFTDGIYRKNDNTPDNESNRWLGGSNGRTRILFGPKLENAGQIDLVGRPASDDDLEMTVFYKGSRVDQIDLGAFDGELNTYTVDIE